MESRIGLFETSPSIIIRSMLTDGCVTTQADTRWTLAAGARVRDQDKPRGICGGDSGAEAGFSTNCSVLSCQCYSVAAPYQLMCHPGDEQWVRQRPSFTRA